MGWVKSSREVTHIGVADTARLIRKALKENFPDTKFSVRSEKYSGGASINVTYNGSGGGPIREDVESITSFFKSSGFDGMIDMAYSKYHYLLPDGTFINGNSTGTVGSLGYVEGYHNELPEGAVEVRFGSDYVFVRDEGPKRHREDCEYSDMDWWPNGGCTIGIPKREEDLIYGKAVPFHSIG